MKNMQYILASLLLLFATSCELDNYDGPNAVVFGGIYDAQTGELVEQEIGTQGEASNLQVIEYGYAIRNPQGWKIMTTGEYRNNLVFAGTYDVVLNKGNFIAIDTIKEHKFVPGDNKLDFKVTPNIRIKDVKVEKIAAVGNVSAKIRATCKLEFANPISTGKIQKLGIFAQTDRFPGNHFNSAAATISLSDKNLGYANRQSYATQVFTVELDLSTSPGANLKPGRKYFFRVGAQPEKLGENIAERFNYAPVVEIEL